MLTLVLGDSLLLMFVGWEGVGFCSWGLIGFWHKELANSTAGNKAFIVNRIGDFGFVLGIFLLFWTLDARGHGTLDFTRLREHAHLLEGAMLWGLPVATLVTLFLFVGATGKSAQIPLYVWLPDAMAGPTPVSALIHAATMVTAGVYLLARMFPLIGMSVTVQAAIAVTGGVTAFYAATCALAQRDLKRVLAYSTISQIGYMTLGVGCGAVTAATFHLLVHAFFKALLFLGAGCVIAAMHHEQDIFRMGGLRKAIPLTFWPFLAGAACLAGLPLTGGFFSKDSILAAVWLKGGALYGGLFCLGLLTALLTSVYTFRMVYLVFFGEKHVGVPLAGTHGAGASPAPTRNRMKCTWFGIIGDGTMPSEGSDWYKYMEFELPPDTQLFHQPSGMSPEAENLQWLMQTPETLKLAEDDPQRLAQGRTYYERFMRSNTEDWIKRYVHAEYGPDPGGSAVFGSSFKNSFHVVESLEPVHGHPLLIGQDFGRDPWSLICQMDHRGRLLILEECEAEDMGLELHIQRTLRPRLMQQRYIGRKVAIVGDPAGRAKDTLYEETSFDLLKKNGFMCFPAPTNDIDPRIRAVESFLLSQRDGGPAIVFDRSRCPTLVRAMGGGYRYAKMRSGERKPKPEKGPEPYSHVADTLQYVCLASHYGVTGSMLPLIIRHMEHAKPREALGPLGWT
jgi:NADH:ubiquinone oxidoreductase subunit 2 (subunit N)